MFLTRYSNNDWDKIFRHSVDLFDRMEMILDDQQFSSSLSHTFPPHNIRKKDNSYLIEMAVAGFNKDEINIPIHNLVTVAIPKMLLIGKILKKSLS